AIPYSYRKSALLRTPRTITLACNSCAKFTVTSSGLSSTSILGISFSASLIRSARSSGVNKYFLAVLVIATTYTLSKISAAFLAVSTCPLVIGSKLPGNKAIVIISPFDKSSQLFFLNVVLCTMTNQLCLQALYDHQFLPPQLCDY